MAVGCYSTAPLSLTDISPGCRLGRRFGGKLKGRFAYVPERLNLLSALWIIKITKQTYNNDMTKGNISG